jgi:hypothetical protein
MLFKRKFPSDIRSSTVQRDFSSYLRIGVVDQVYPERGVCTLRWLDKPGYRAEVLITQASPKSWEIPEKGSVVLVGFDPYERARILRYINLGHEERMREIKSLPKMKEGEKLWEVGGSYFYLKRNGDVVISTANQGYFLIENSTSTFKSESVNWKVTTDGGIMYKGIIKRFTDNGDGTKSNEEITNLAGDNLTEFRLRLVETADGTLGLKGIEDPFIDLVMGTYVDADGNIVNKKDSPTINNNKEIAVRIVLKSGIKLFIDKEGRLSIEGAKLNINKAKVDVDDLDIAEGLEENDSSLGTKGQHVAREHDEITIPISTAFVDEEHSETVSVSPDNIQVLTTLASAIMSPAGPCTLNPALLSDPSLKLKGIITQGSSNVLIGDE